MVRSHSYSRVFGIACLIAAGSWSTSACLAGDDDDNGTGGTGGSTAKGGSSGAGGSMAGMSAMGGTGNTGSCTVGASAIACGMKPATSTTFIDFTTYTSDKKWGPSSGVNGGTSLYKGTGENLTVAAEGSALKVTGTIPSMSYAGLVFWVSACTDASEYDGVKLSISGDSSVSASIQMESSEDYPVDPSANKGECAFTSCDTMWSECMPPRTTLTVTADATEVELPWANFTGGLPVDTFTPNQLVGVQYQFECQADADCAVNLTLGSVTFLDN
jgi:hypothetical protein